MFKPIEIECDTLLFAERSDNKRLLRKTLRRSGAQATSDMKSLSAVVPILELFPCKRCRRLKKGVTSFWFRAEQISYALFYAFIWMPVVVLMVIPGFVGFAWEKSTQMFHRVLEHLGLSHAKSVPNAPDAPGKDTRAKHFSSELQTRTPSIHLRPSSIEKSVTSNSMTPSLPKALSMPRMTNTPRILMAPNRRSASSQDWLERRFQDVVSRKSSEPEHGKSASR